MKIFEQRLSRDNFSLAGLILFFLLAVLPLLMGIGYALMYSFGAIGVMSDGITPEYWREVLTGSEIFYSFGFSAYIATVAMGITTLLSLSGSILLNKEIEKGLFSYLIYLPLAIPAMVAALFVFQMLSKSGLLSRLSYNMGITESINAFPGLINDPWGIGIITAHVMMATPFFLIYFQNIYRSEKLDELSRLATSLGSGRLATSLRVQVPVLLTRAMPTLVLYYIFTLGSYEIPLLLGRESPQMVSVLSIRKLRRFNLLDIPEAYIIAIVYIVIVLSAVLYLFKKRRLTYDL